MNQIFKSNPITNFVISDARFQNKGNLLKENIMVFY